LHYYFRGGILLLVLKKRAKQKWTLKIKQ
jgi:hypothetical protein